MWSNNELCFNFTSKLTWFEIWRRTLFAISTFCIYLFLQIYCFRLVNQLQSIQTRFMISTYIFEKLIDDNVCIIQTIIAKYKNTLQNVIIVFLDQKKIFDRISHEFLWAILKKFDISIQFIFWVKFLYVDVKIIIYINDHQSKRMTIKCEIKQNDFLNCSLFVIVIEILICYILQDTRISKIVIKLLIIKLTMFVDDTTVILKNQKEINVLIEILKLYEKASKTEMN